MSNSKKKGWKDSLHEIIYEADTPAGKLFDVVLMIVIIASIILVMLESVESIDTKFHDFLNISEWVITILFSIEYIARIVTVKKPLKYVTSFYGVIDLLSTIPKYLSLIFGGVHALAALRALRLLRIFRILKLKKTVFTLSNIFIKYYCSFILKYSNKQHSHVYTTLIKFKNISLKRLIPLAYVFP